MSGPGGELMRRHPWNTAFEWSAPSSVPTTLTGEEVDAYDRHGYVVRPGMIDGDTLAGVIGECDAFEAEVDAGLRQLPDGRLAIAEADAIVFAPHLASRSAVLGALARDPRVVGAVVDLLGPDVNLYWDQVVYKKPEKPRRFPWHQDNGYTFVEPQQYVTVWLALTDATVDNGCPWVAPGVHRHGTLHHDYVDPLGFQCFTEPPSKAPAPVGAGGAVIFSSLTPHLTGPNTTEAVRKAYILQYAPVGAELLEGDPAQGPPTGRRRCDDPVNQFPVARNGRRVPTE